MTKLKAERVLEKLNGLRIELVDLAFSLERKGRLDAADLAISVSARLEDLRESLAEENPGVVSNAPSNEASLPVSERSR